MSSTQELIAKIDATLRQPLQRLSLVETIELSTLLQRCRAALIARDGIEQSWPAPYRDEELDVQPDDAELAARATSGKGWAH